MRIGDRVTTATAAGARMGAPATTALTAGPLRSRVDRCLGAARQGDVRVVWDVETTTRDVPVLDEVLPLLLGLVEERQGTGPVVLSVISAGEGVVVAAERLGDRPWTTSVDCLDVRLVSLLDLVRPTGGLAWAEPVPDGGTCFVVDLSSAGLG